jgi:hypothetical protein
MPEGFSAAQRGVPEEEIAGPFRGDRAKVKALNRWATYDGENWVIGKGDKALRLPRGVDPEGVTKSFLTNAMGEAVLDEARSNWREGEEWVEEPIEVAQAKPLGAADAQAQAESWREKWKEVLDEDFVEIGAGVTGYEDGSSGAPTLDEAEYVAGRLEPSEASLQAAREAHEAMLVEVLEREFGDAPTGIPEFVVQREEEGLLSFEASARQLRTPAAAGPTVDRAFDPVFNPDELRFRQWLVTASDEELQHGFQLLNDAIAMQAGHRGRSPLQT